MIITHCTVCSERWTIGRLCLVNRHLFEQVSLLKEANVSDVNNADRVFTLHAT